MSCGTSGNRPAKQHNQGGTGIMTESSTLTTLVSFNDANGAAPDGDLIADANGDLFGTSSGDGGANDGTVFEIVKTAGGYASTPTTLASFDGANGLGREGGLIADSNGDLFGTTFQGGANGDNGTVFEIAKTDGGYASTPTTLVSFNDTTPPFRRRPDRRRQRRPFRHDDRPRSPTGDVNRWRGVRDCQDRRRATRARRPHWSASTERTARGPCAP